MWQSWDCRRADQFIVPSNSQFTQSLSSSSSGRSSPSPPLPHSPLIIILLYSLFQKVPLEVTTDVGNKCSNVNFADFISSQFLMVITAGKNKIQTLLVLY